MNRSRPNRLSAFLWAVLFLLSTGEGAFGLHPCPHHDGGLSAAVADASPAHHAGHGTAGPAADDPDPSGGHSGQCTCASACQAGGGALLPAPEVRAALQARMAGAAPVPAAAADLLPARFPPHFLPYGLAPPSLG